MKKFTIVIEETLADRFEVEAETEEEALEIAIQKYKNAEFILQPESCYFSEAWPEENPDNRIDIW